MPQVHSVGRLFTHRMAYPSTDFPLVDKGYSQEISDPYRCARPWVFRLPWTRQAMVVGIWGEEMSEEDAMFRAINGELIGETGKDELIDYVPPHAVE